ncbi:MAG: threonine synthase, partial [Oscillospiraceae bacterium]|nr:threonine synthase [Oscillospiraceae bacterium]
GVTRLVRLDERTHALELWHGPTAAFKDMALQIMPRMMRVSSDKGPPIKKILILVATSGDTGKAALEGFKDVPGIEIAVFYPEEGVSEIQRRQMISQEGDNVHVFAVKGNFDDCQNAVKEAFNDTELLGLAKQKRIMFSSANSINWGRLCPQIVYYISAYARMLRDKIVRPGVPINICVPTGNFGNILAAYYAKLMGVPVEKLICASNSNKILTDFINTGVYDRNREFHATISPSMDILVSSNVERLLYHLTGGNDGLIKEWFGSLKETGRFEVDDNVKAKLKELFHAGWCSEEDTSDTIKTVFNEHGYLMDTHTAVAYKVLQDFNGEFGKRRVKTLITSTANPYKFSESVYRSIYGDVKKFGDLENPPELEDDSEIAEEVNEEIIETHENEYQPDFAPASEDGNGSEPDEMQPHLRLSREITEEDIMFRLEQLTGLRIPNTIDDIWYKEPRFDQILDKSEIKATVANLL